MERVEVYLNQRAGWIAATPALNHPQIIVDSARTLSLHLRARVIDCDTDAITQRWQEGQRIS